MDLPRFLILPRRERPPSERCVRLFQRLSAFERVQLLLVLWIIVSEMLRGGFGVTMLPQLPQRETAPPLTPGIVLVRMAGAAMYPLAAFVASRRFPLWHRSTRHFSYFLGVLAGLHALAFLGSLVQVLTGFGWMFYVHRTFEFVVYTVFAHGMLYGERYHEKEREELRLREEMAGSTADRMRAQVRALKMEWSPRFLTGTLESIGELLSRDVAGAKRLLLGLSSVLRRTLAHVRMETVRLEQEVEFVREVLRVEALRRPGLAAEWAIDEETLEMPVPHMALVTIVYQALQDGEAASPPRIRISATPESSAVRLRVDVHGVPADAAGTAASEGIGERLGAVYGAGHEFQRTALGPDGVRLELRCASGPRARETGDAPVRPAGHGLAARSSARPAPVESQPAIGRTLEFGTYATFLLFYTLLTLYTAHVQVDAGRVVLAAPAWLYVGGMGFFAALWWGSMVMAARYLSTRFPFRRGNWPRRLVLHLLGAVFVSILNGAAYMPFQRLVVEGGSVLIGFMAYWEWGDLAVYPPLAGIAHGFIYAREYHAKRISELRLRSQLSESELRRTEAELQALKAELNPHFLFNALNTVSSLMHTRVDEARRVVAHLSTLLHHVLESGSLQEVSVEEEVEFIRHYMEIEQARFGDALRIEYRLDPDTLRARVPHLLIQPLIENAVKHGLRPRGGTGQVILSSQRVGNYLHLTVTDDGVGPAQASRADGTGTGLANVRQRLEQLYGEEHVFEFAPVPTGGARARIRIPFSEQPRAAPAGESALVLQAT